MHHSCLCDSAKNLMSVKHGSKVVGENAFGQSVCNTSWFVILSSFPANVASK